MPKISSVTYKVDIQEEMDTNRTKPYAASFFEETAATKAQHKIPNTSSSVLNIPLAVLR